MLLVIGFGNELRRDDGVGPRVARAIADWGISDVRALAVHQLTPELSEEIARAEEVVFIDAALNGGTGHVSVHSVQSTSSNSLANHASRPAALLGMTEALYGWRSVAWQLSISVRDVNFGEGLSPETEVAAARALRYLQLWLARRVSVSRET
jgi:hydrogenase maturation protease